MPQRLRKIRKQRGYRTHGYGKVGQHRKKGSQGFRKGARHKHLWSYVVRYEPEYFGKWGFTSPKSLRQKAKVINVGNLDEMAKRLLGKSEEGESILDLEKLGYTKLLGTGKVTKPLVVRVESFSKSAAEKLKDAGGRVLAETVEKGE